MRTSCGDAASDLAGDKPAYLETELKLLGGNKIDGLIYPEIILNPSVDVILLGYVKTDKGDDYLIEHLGNFIIFLKRLGVTHRIHHLAIAFSKEHYDTPYDVKTADITCVRLY